MAHEIVSGNKYQHKVDIWSIGVITFYLLSGYPPFDGRTKNQLSHAIKTAKLNFDNPIWDRVSVEAKDFITKALDRNVETRPSAEELSKHKWITESSKIRVKTLNPKV